MAGSKNRANKKDGGREVVVSKSPAEFFAENQSIAGFDNAGKSLYTTLRELVENSLDACESAGILPDVEVNVEEMTEKEFNELRGIGGKKKKVGEEGEEGEKDENTDGTPVSSKTDGTQPSSKTKKKPKAVKQAYFKVTVKDNGCGMVHEDIPQLLGRVLSGSKYGVRQTRGKFGLGAKMALIWSKKSTGVPITVLTSHIQARGKMSKCVLDIDIYRNEPRVLEHSQQQNNDHFVGTEISLLISGKWSTYKSHILEYLHQLAIITPYAKLTLAYRNQQDSKKDISLTYNRRSTQMPPLAHQVNHHPSSVNNLLVQQLIRTSTAPSLLKFLPQTLAAITPHIATDLISQLHLQPSTPPSTLTDKQITHLVQLLRSYPKFKPPDASCLSPLGEYNLNLGIQKVIQPDIVATFRDRPGAYDGHPFLIEAAVSLGGPDAKVGITVVRFANRIPLLFEPGADVVTR